MLQQLVLTFFCVCHLWQQEEVLARSQSKQFYQHLLTNFQQLKQDLTASRPCFLLPRNTANGASSGSIFWAVTCALDDDLTGPDELRQQQMLTGEALACERWSCVGSISVCSNSQHHPGGQCRLVLLLTGHVCLLNCQCRARHAVSWHFMGAATDLC